MGWDAVSIASFTAVGGGSDLRLALAFHRRCWSMSRGLLLALKSQRANLRGWVVLCGGLVLVGGGQK